MFKIFNIVFSLSPYNTKLNSCFQNYVFKTTSCDFSITTVKVKEIVRPKANLLYDGEKITWLSEKKYETVLYKKDNKYSHALKYSQDWKNVELIVEEGFSLEREYFIYGTIFAFIALRHNGLNLHGSTIAYNHQGIIFSGPSQSGKSTQSHLWKSVFDDKVAILNDDKPIIDMHKHHPDVYGTPFAGSSKLNTNTHVPLKAIVIVKKATDNYVVKTKRSEAYLHLLRESTRPEYSKSEMEKYLSLLEQLIDQVPVYTLYCTKEEKAVHVLHNILFEGDSYEEES